MDMISDMTNIISKVLLGDAGEREYNEMEVYVATSEYLNETYIVNTLLGRLVSQGKVNDAENALFEALEEDSSPAMFTAAIEFYKGLSELSEERLKDCNFSREEIADGLKEVKKMFEETI